MSGGAKIDVIVTEVEPVTAQIRRIRMEREDGSMLPTFSGGAHTVVEMPDHQTLRRNPYSLMGDPADRSCYMISVRRDDDGRGGSKFMHERVERGMKLTISNPVNLFALDLRARKHLLIAGGIGITPFMAQTRQLAAAHLPFELHYVVRSAQHGAYCDELVKRFPNDVVVYDRGRGDAFDLALLLRGQPLGTHVYVCGPERLISAVRSSAAALGWPAASVHYEEFLAPASGEPFTARLVQSGKTVRVGEHQSLLEAIESAGVDAPYLCRGGACGQCETDVVEYDGTFVHNDHWLTAEDRESGRKIMPCVSRFKGKTLVLER